MLGHRIADRYPRTPDGWTETARREVGPFTTRVEYRRADGSAAVWESRFQRKHASALSRGDRVRHRRYWQPRRASWWIGVLFAIALLNPRGMGMGDVKLCLLLGAMLGWQVFLALFLGVLAGTVPAIVLAFKHGIRARKLAIPFAPFLVVGSLATLFFGDALLTWWNGLFS